MAESNQNEEFKLKYIPNATTITYTSLATFPNVEHFFKKLLKNIKIEIKHVGESFRYHKDVEKHRCYPAHGLFMDYFIRKHLSNQYNIELTDTYAEQILIKPEDYFTSKNWKLEDSIREHYEIYKDPKTQAMDIIRSIRIVSLSHLIYYQQFVPKIEYTIYKENLREVIRYLEQLPYKSVDLNPKVSCEYFDADADLIFDSEVIYEIKTSKYQSLANNRHRIPFSKFYQSIIYGFGYYKKTGIKIEKFKIYNPLLGDEFSIELKNIDFELFERVLKRDVILYSRLEELLTDEIVLDKSLFNKKNEL